MTNLMIEMARLAGVPFAVYEHHEGGDIIIAEPVLWRDGRPGPMPHDRGPVDTPLGPSPADDTATLERLVREEGNVRETVRIWLHREAAEAEHNCCVCGERIRMQIFRDTGFCSQKCESGTS